ncbi:MAG: M56 family metallopeptidase, partial [Terriglobales bacterium]
MSNVTSWISPEVLRTLGWTLLHFLWQGAGLAALFAVASAVCRSASARYVLAVGALVLMLVSPVITFAWLHAQANPAVRTGAEGAMTWAETSTLNATALSGSRAPVVAGRQSEPAVGMLWLVEAWFLGVLLLSLRTAGGLFLIERMRGKEIRPVAAELYARCMALQRRMGLERVIRYCECHRLDAPAVLGWFRPVVLLPVRALTGLNEEQIEAVIAHELAHIRRFDCFVNLFQIATETLLFYHPAVWWVSQRVRAEREHCCDDEAIAICGDAVNYARALTLMEEWRTAPALMMAANRSPLGERVVRLLGLNGATGRIR